MPFISAWADWEGEAGYWPLTLLMMHSRNVAYIETPSVSRLDLKRARQQGVEADRVLFRTCRLKMDRIVRRHGAGGEAAAMRQHWVMGHFKVRKTGTFWWSPYTRGDLRKGMVVKEYEVYGRARRRDRPGAPGGLAAGATGCFVIIRASARCRTATRCKLRRRGGRLRHHRLDAARGDPRRWSARPSRCSRPSRPRPGKDRRPRSSSDFLKAVHEPRRHRAVGQRPGLDRRTPLKYVRGAAQGGL